MAAPLLSLPPASKAALVAAVVVAQKPANVSTNLHEAARIEEDVSATLNPTFQIIGKLEKFSDGNCGLSASFGNIAA